MVDDCGKDSWGGGIATAILLATTILFAALFGVLWFKGGYTDKLLVKLGISKEQGQQRSDYWTCYSWQRCLEQLDVDVDICFFGDSITNATDFQNYFPNESIVNLGLSGDSLDGMIQRIDMIKTVKPEVVFVEGGINGFKTLGVQGTLKEYEVLLNTLKEELPDVEIYVQGMFPIAQEKETDYGNNIDIKEANGQIKALCEEMGITYIDIYSKMVDEEGYMKESYTVDGLHLTDKGKEVWLSVLDEYIE